LKLELCLCRIIYKKFCFSGEFEGKSVFEPFEKVVFVSEGAFDVNRVSWKGFNFVLWTGEVHIDLRI